MTSLLKIGLVIAAIDHATAPVQKIEAGLGRLGQAATRISGPVRALKGALTELGREADSIKRMGEVMAGAGIAAGAGITKAIAAFSGYETAQVGLKVSVMQVGGKIDQAQFAALSRLADRLGKDYMGSTEDFYKMFRVLTEQGVSAEKILGGVGKAVADFAAVTGEGYNEAAIKVAKFQDSLGILDKDMVRFTGIASKAKFAFGLDTSEMYYALPYMSAGLKALGMQGVNASKGVLQMMGVLSQAGLPASEVGTSIGQLVNRMADFHNKLNKNGKEMKEIRATLLGTGIELNFWDSKGNFAGIESMIQQFEKLNVLSPQKKLEVMKKLFGDVAGRAVAILGEKGLKGWAEAGERMGKQASLTERVAAIQETLAFKWDSFTGTLKGFGAAIGEAISKSSGLKWVLDKLNDTFDVAKNWIKNHERLAAVLAVATIGITSMAIAGGGALFVLGAISGGLPTAIRGCQALASAGRRVSSAFSRWNTIRKLPDAMFGDVIPGRAAASVGWLTRLRGAFMATAAGVRAFSLSLLTSPIGWIALAIGVAALVIYKYWRPISGFFKGLWSGLKEGLKGLEPAWNVFEKVAPILFPIIIPLKWIFNAIKALFKPVDDVGGKAQSMGLRFGRAIGSILSSVLQLPAKMLAAGANIIESLFKGMMSKLDKPIAAMKGLAQRLRNFLPFSPAKEGALRDINRVRIVETIAESMRPAPLVKAMKGVTAAAMIATAPAAALAQPSTTPVRPAVKSLARPMTSASAGGAMQISFSPQITIQGGGNADQVRHQVNEAMTISFAEFERLMKRYEEQRARRSF